MKDIIKMYKNGELERDNDESGSNGFWDKAAELAKDEEQQEVIYNALLELFEETIKAYN